MRMNKISIAIIIVIIIILGIFFMQRSSEEATKVEYKLNKTQIDVNETSEQVNVIKKESDEPVKIDPNIDPKIDSKSDLKSDSKLEKEELKEPSKDELEQKETERLLGILPLPSVIKEHTEKITKIDDDFYHVLTNAGKKYMFRPSSEDIVDISNGLVMVDANDNEYYFLNGIYLPFEDYVEYKVKEERRKMLNKNSEGMEKKVWVCDIDEKSFLVVVGIKPDINYADYYYFDEELKKIRFRKIFESEKEEYKDIECE